MPIEIRDAIYGDIVIGEEERRLLDTYEMQRLRHIKQLGFVQLVYPSANHSRFEHALGARWLAQKIVRISDLRLSKEDEQTLYLGALLHDVAEPCLQHVTERLHDRGFPRHEEILGKVLDGSYRDIVMDRRGSETRFVCEVLSDDQKRNLVDTLVKQTAEKRHLRELIDGLIDCDSLDYLRRDSLYTGLPYGNYDDRIFTSFRIAKSNGDSRIAFDSGESSLSAIISVLRARYTLRKTVYLHHTVLIADSMFIEALENAFSEKVVDQFDVFTLGEDELYQKMRQAATARTLVDQLLSRRLFKRAYVVDNKAPEALVRLIDDLTHDISRRNDFMADIREKTNIDEKDILPIFHPGSSWKDFDQITLMRDNGSTVLLGDLMHEELSLLEDNYRRLWQFILCVNREDLESRERASTACFDFFKYPSEYRPRRPPSELDNLRERLAPLVQELRSENAPVYQVLSELINDGSGFTREELANRLSLEPSTVSHYLTLLNQRLSTIDREILQFQKSGKTKHWNLDPQLRELLAGV